MILFVEKETPTAISGHWLAVAKQGASCLVFDPYGGKKEPWYLDHTFIPKRVLASLNETVPVLATIVSKAGLRPIFNPHRYQRMKDDIDTCGRHSVVRLWHGDMSNDEYHHWITSYGPDYDATVTQLTNEKLMGRGPKMADNVRSQSVPYVTGDSYNSINGGSMLSASLGLQNKVNDLQGMVASRKAKGAGATGYALAKAGAMTPLFHFGSGAPPKKVRGGKIPPGHRMIARKAGTDLSKIPELRRQGQANVNRIVLSGLSTFAQELGMPEAAAEAVKNGILSIQGGAREDVFDHVNSAYNNKSSGKREAPAVDKKGRQLVYQTDNIVAYKDPQTGRVYAGVRGTSDLTDVKAWLPTVAGRLNKTDAYKRAKADMEQLVKQNPNAKIELGGHSLGGAIARQLQRDYSGQVDGVHAFNAAVQPQDWMQKKQPGTTYTYNKYDPLRLLSAGLEDHVTSSNSGRVNLADHGMSNLDLSKEEAPASQLPAVLRPFQGLANWGAAKLNGAGKSALRPAGSTREWRKIRLAVLQRDGRTCAYCGRKATTVDHVTPRDHGGTDAPDNLVAACQKCNGQKSDAY